MIYCDQEMQLYWFVLLNNVCTSVMESLLWNINNMKLDGNYSIVFGLVEFDRHQSVTIFQDMYFCNVKSVM